MNVCFCLSSAVYALGVFWVLNGWFQGMGFPPCARGLTHWFGAGERGTKFAIWNTSHSIGAAGALLVVVFNPTAMALLKSPGSCGADVAVAEGQPLGIPMSYGGPVLGIFAAKTEFIRHMPGRIVGVAEDHDGRRGFVL